MTVRGPFGKGPNAAQRVSVIAPNEGFTNYF